MLGWTDGVGHFIENTFSNKNTDKNTPRMKMWIFVFTQKYQAIYIHNENGIICAL